MMEHIAAFLLIVGCSPDLAACREMPTPTAIYEALDECEAERPAIAAGFEGAAPRLFAQCFEVDPLLTETDAEIVWEVTADGKFSARVEPYVPGDVLIASNRGEKETGTVARR